jgi:toxin ParE1/3/4
MPASVVFDKSASREYLKARRWYAARAGEQIATAFADEVDRAVNRIAESPSTGTEFRTRYRWVRLRRFPYLIYYRVVSTDTLVVLAVAHKRRRSGYWMRRDKN